MSGDFMDLWCSYRYHAALQISGADEDQQDFRTAYEWLVKAGEDYPYRERGRMDERLEQVAGLCVRQAEWVPNSTTNTST